MNAGQGRSIFMLGLPCSGKSTLTKLLGKRMQCPYFYEPEEIDWPESVKQRSLSGHFGAAMWFRSLRCYHYHQAVRLASEGKTVLVDSYFDKVFSYCLGQPHMDWLISKEDPYFSSLLKIAELDLAQLPLPDTLVFFDLEFDEWMALTMSRNRGLERNWFNRNFFHMQTYLKRAVEDLSLAGCNVIAYKPEINDVESSVEKLYQMCNETAIEHTP